MPERLLCARCKASNWRREKLRPGDVCSHCGSIYKPIKPQERIESWNCWKESYNDWKEKLPTPVTTR